MHKRPDTLRGDMEGANVELEAEDQFKTLLETISKHDVGFSSTPGCRRIVEKAEESGEYIEAVKQLQAFADRRNEHLDRIVVRCSYEDIEITEQYMETLLKEIKVSRSQYPHLLGRGMTAEVRTLNVFPKETDRLMCVKFVIDPIQYKRGATMLQEIRMLDKLRDLDVAGVRSPEPSFAFGSFRLDGYVMEHLDAVSLKDIMNNNKVEGSFDSLPDDFDIDDFFERVTAYIDEVHKRDIAHRDLHLGNIMIDRETGEPRIIDFGRSLDFTSADLEHTSKEEQKEIDHRALKKSKEELRLWLMRRA